MVKMVFLLLLLAMVMISPVVTQMHHIVGDERGWNPSTDVAAWSNGRTFRVGDKLWFAYSDGDESVAELKSEEEYESCDAKNPIKLLTDGLNSVFLDGEGIRYFISTKDENCKKGLKLNVDVQPKDGPFYPFQSPPPPPPPSPPPPVWPFQSSPPPPPSPPPPVWPFQSPPPPSPPPPPKSSPPPPPPPPKSSPPPPPSPPPPKSSPPPPPPSPPPPSHSPPPPPSPPPPSRSPPPPPPPVFSPPPPSAAVRDGFSFSMVLFGFWLCFMVV